MAGIVISLSEMSVAHFSPRVTIAIFPLDFESSTKSTPARVWNCVLSGSFMIVIFDFTTISVSSSHEKIHIA